MAVTTKLQYRQLKCLLAVHTLPAEPELIWGRDGTIVVIAVSRYEFSDRDSLQKFLHGILDIDGSLSPEHTQDDVVELLNTFAD